MCSCPRAWAVSVLLNSKEVRLIELVLALDGKALPAKLVKSSAPLKYLKDIYSSHTELCVE